MLNLAAAARNSSADSAGQATAYANYSPLRSADSLRADSIPADAASSSETAPASSDSTDESAVSSSALEILLIVLLLLLLLQLSLYRYLPVRVTILLDQFSWRNPAPVGGAMKRQPTQLGAAFTVAFLFSGVLLALYLASAPNVQRSTTLLPPSSVERAGIATTNLQVTVRAYVGAAALAAGVCSPVDTRTAASSQLVSGSSGFSSAFHIRTVHDLSSGMCVLAVDCLGCSLLGSASALQLSFPYSAQLLEWEVELTSAAPHSAVRRYGVLTQQQGQLIDAQGELSFSVTEAFYTDSTKSPTVEGSGYELDFQSYSTLQQQSLTDYSSASQVGLTLTFAKSPVVVESTVSTRLSDVQILASVLSAVMSLMGVFAFLFSFSVEVLPKLRLVPGHVVDEREAGGQLFIREDQSSRVSKFRLDTDEGAADVELTQPGGGQVQLPMTEEGHTQQQPLSSPSRQSSSTNVHVFSPTTAAAVSPQSASSAAESIPPAMLALLTGMRAEMERDRARIAQLSEFKLSMEQRDAALSASPHIPSAAAAAAAPPSASSSPRSSSFRTQKLPSLVQKRMSNNQ
jgi:hypothetical protein